MLNNAQCARKRSRAVRHQSINQSEIEHALISLDDPAVANLFYEEEPPESDGDAATTNCEMESAWKPWDHRKTTPWGVDEYIKIGDLLLIYETAFVNNELVIVMVFMPGMPGTFLPIEHLYLFAHGRDVTMPESLSKYRGVY